MKPVFIEAYACDDNGDGPQYAKLIATEDFCAQLKKLQALCEEHNLSELRVYQAPEAWGPGNIEEELRFTCAEMVVTGSSFWFTDQPKHADYSVETRAQEIGVFLDAVSIKNDAPIFLGDNAEEMAELVAEEESDISPT